ncbi:response regulator [Alsobacter sp. R-9]
MFKTPVFPNVPVLVVDDSPFARRILRSMLEPVGIRQIYEASDGGDALQRLAQFKPALIILDWNLPVLNAKGVLDVLRDPKTSSETDVPVIVMSASPTRRIINEASERNVKHVLKKPFAPKALWQRMATFFDEDPTNLFDQAPQALLGIRKPPEEKAADRWQRKAKDLIH